VSYAVQLGREKLTSLRIAPLAGLPPSCGLLGIEIVLPGRGILINQTVEAEPACRAGMAAFVFHPLPESREMLEFRVFARGLDAEVRLLEWQRPAWGFGKIMRKPFFSYIFDE
jgi:hypothetical protein